MSSRHLLRAGLAACLSFAGAAAQATITYSGDQGVLAQFFQLNGCTGCHAGATPTSGNGGRSFNTYSNVTATVTGTATGINLVNYQAAYNAGNWAGGWPPMPYGVDTSTTANKPDNLALLNSWIAGGAPNTAVPTVSTGSATSIGHFNATLNGTGNGGGLSSTYFFNYGLTTGYGSNSGNDTPADTGGGSTNTASYAIAISGLTCGTTYNFRARGSNSAGSATAGGNNSFVTDACPFINDIVDTSVTEDAGYSTTATSSNTAGLTSTTYSLDATSLANGFTINSGTGAIQLPDSAISGASTTNTVYNVTVSASYVGPGGSDPDTEVFQLTVTPVNDAPSLAVIPAQAATEDTLWQYTGSATDIDDSNNGTNLTWSLLNAPAGMTVNSTGTVSWTPANGVTTSGTVTLRVADGGENGAAAASRTFTVSVTPVNDAPSLAVIPAQAATEDTLWQYTGSATDVDDTNNGTNLVWSLSNAPSGMTVSSTGTVSWTPANGVTTSGTVTLQVADGGENGSTPASRTFTVTVTPVNDAPQITSGAPTSAVEGSTFSHQVTVSDPDDTNNGTNLAWSLTNAPSGMTVSSTGLIQWTPGNGVTTSGLVTVTVQDGGEDGALPASQNFTLVVTAVNQGPTLSPVTSTSATEDVQYSYQVVVSDIDDPNNGADLVWDLTNEPSGMVISNTGVITWTPANGVLTSGSVTVTVQDGGENGALPDSENFTITVTAVNDAPSLAVIPAQAATEDTLWQYTGSVTDVDDTNNGTNLTWSLQNAPAGMTVNSTGTVSWTPVNGVLTSGTVTLRVADGGENGAAAATQNFTVAVTPVNDPPSLAAIPAQAATEDTLWQYTGSATDVDDTNNGTNLVWSLSNAPSGMTVNSTGTVSWTPGNNILTSGTVTLQVADGGENGSTPASRTFTVTVTPVNDAPGITSSAVTTDDGSGAYNYDVAASDPDNGDTLYYSLTTAPSGMIINSGNGLISWTVPSDITSSGTTPYDVTVRVTDRNDGSGLDATQSFTITIQDADSDNISDYYDNCVSTANYDQTNTDTVVNAPGDAQGNACDSDDDNDGVSDSVESANGYDPLVVNDHATLDLDGDGLSNLDEFNDCVANADATCDAFGTDSVAPVLTTSDLTVDATGYFTPVPVSATATDAPDGVRLASIATIDGVAVTATSPYSFRPGSHTVEWEAYDTTGNRGTIVQNVVVKPQATLGGSQVVGTATTVPVTVRLNGDVPAPAVDVVLSYTVGGTAVAGTHYDALPGTITLAGGIRQADINVVVNTPAAGADKTIVITLTGVSAGEAVLGDASQRDYSITITAQPVAPELALRALQASVYRQVVYKNDGSVTLEAMASDANGGSLALSWNGAGLPLTGSGSTRDFDPSGVAVGNYDVEVTVTDASNLSTTRRLALTVLGSVPTLDPAADTDGDNIDDASEGVVDANGNGLLDFLDVNTGEAPESIQLSLNSDGLLTMAVADSGLTLVAGNFAIAAQSATTQQAGIQVYETQIASGTSPILDTNYAAIGAMVNFEVRGLNTANRVAHVVLPQTAVILPNAQWRALNANGQWTTFVPTAGSVVAAVAVGSVEGDSIASAPRDDDGQCPAPQSDAYEPGLVAGHVCVQLTVSDGGPNDADGEANGSVEVTGAVTVLRDEASAVAPEESQSGGSADPFTLMLLALATLLIRRKEPIR